MNRFVRDVRKHGGWAKASRASGYYTAEDLDAFFDEYSELLAKYGHGRQDAPPGARLMRLRMFYIPDDPTEPEPEALLGERRASAAENRRCCCEKGADWEFARAGSGLAVRGAGPPAPAYWVWGPPHPTGQQARGCGCDMRCQRVSAGRQLTGSM